MREQKTLGKGWNASLLMAYLIGFCVLWELEKLINFPWSGDVYQWIKVGELILLGAVLTRIRFRGNLWYWVLVAGVLWLFTAAALHSEQVLTKTEKHLMKAVLVYLLCPAVGLLISGGNLKRFLKIFTACWTVAFTALCLAGLYCVFRGIRITDYSGKYELGLTSGAALTLLSDHYNTTAVNLSASMMVALFGFAISDRRVSKILYLLSAGCMFVCLSLTGGRSGELSGCIGLGAAFVIALQPFLHRKIRIKWLQVVISLALVLMLTVVGMLVMKGTQTVVNRLLVRHNAGSLIPVAMAEDAPADTPEPEIKVAETEITEVQGRSFFQRDFLSGRDVVWREALNAFRNHPELWWTGTSISTAMTQIRALSNIPKVSHFHNIFLQILIETGIPGLLISLVFLFFVLRGLFRLFSAMDRPLWERFLTLPVVTILLIEMVESCSRLGAKAYLNLILMLFAGLVLVFSDKRKEA